MSYERQKNKKESKGLTNGFEKKMKEGILFNNFF